MSKAERTKYLKICSCHDCPFGKHHVSGILWSIGSGKFVDVKPGETFCEKLLKVVVKSDQIRADIPEDCPLPDFNQNKRECCCCGESANDGQVLCIACGGR